MAKDTLLSSNKSFGAAVEDCADNVAGLLALTEDELDELMTGQKPGNVKLLKKALTSAASTLDETWPPLTYVPASRTARSVIEKSN